MSDRKTMLVSSAVFLTGVSGGVIAAVRWGSLPAIAAPIAAGLVAAIIILVAKDE